MNWLFIIINCILIACLVCLYIYYTGKKKKSVRPSSNVLSIRKQKQTLDTALKNLNCSVSWHKDQDEITANFDFQSGHFGARLSQDNAYCHLSYLFIFSTQLCNINIVRRLCNQCNSNSDNSTIIYTIDRKKGSVDVHILGVVLMKDACFQISLANTLKDMFSWQATFVNEVNGMIAKESKGYDMESREGEYNHNIELVREQEIMHQNNDSDTWRSDDGSPFVFHRLLHAMMGIENFLPMRMVLFYSSGNVKKIPADEINDFDVSSVLIDDGKCVKDSAMATFVYIDKMQPDLERTIVFHFNHENTVADAIYYRVTLTQIPLSVDKKINLTKENKNVKSVSVLLAFDLKSSKQKLDEFRYHWKETLAKQDKGDLASLTADEKLLLDWQDRTSACSYYFGIRLNSQKRYIEALPYLLDAFRRMMGVYRSLSHPQLDRLYDLSYKIGFIYDELHQYDKAYYYLDILEPLHCVLYTEEYVNNLVNSKDCRAMAIVDNLLSVVSLPHEGGEQDDSSSEGISDFFNFLKRRKAYLLVETGRYDDAENMLRKMLDEPDNMDFANTELSVIKKRRKE